MVGELVLVVLIVRSGATTVMRGRARRARRAGPGCPAPRAARRRVRRRRAMVCRCPAPTRSSAAETRRRCCARLEAGPDGAAVEALIGEQQHAVRVVERHDLAARILEGLREANQLADGHCRPIERDRRDQIRRRIERAGWRWARIGRGPALRPRRERERDDAYNVTPTSSATPTVINARSRPLRATPFKRACRRVGYIGTTSRRGRENQSQKRRQAVREPPRRTNHATSAAPRT